MTEPASSPSAAEPAAREPRRARRDSTNPLLGGVASGLATHFGVPVLWVRVALVASTLLNGFGVALYAGMWIFLPSDRDVVAQAPGLEGAQRDGRRPPARARIADAGPAIALGALLFGIAIAVKGVTGLGSLFWPTALAVAGLALLWRQADEAQRQRWLDPTGRISGWRTVFGDGGWASYGRIAAGVGLVGVAVLVFAITIGGAGGLAPVLIAGIAGVAGLALVIGPWVLRLVRELSTERDERIRSTERADMAAHLHDSVLQTLALIQRNAHDSPTVARLARAQERDLRAWLFTEESRDPTTLGGALRETAARVEQDYPVTVDVVAVGDTPLVGGLRAVADAAGEAVVNAAKHSGVPRIDVYAEVSADAVEVFVRDRGAGFDPTDVPSDRRGVRGSITERMERHGGAAAIRSAPGEGTEVRLKMPLAEQED